MGGRSPVKCFDYKFDIEEWRTFKTMKETAMDLKLDYGRLANWVKKGIVSHTRSAGGKKVVFTESQINILNNRIISGELPIENGKKRVQLSN